MLFFKQDNAPAHIANTTKMWLANKSIRLIFWPSQGPDLNPTQLFEAIKIEWNSPFCKKLSTSLPTRLKHLKKSNGKAIPYEVTLSIHLILAYFLSFPLTS